MPFINLANLKAAVLHLVLSKAARELPGANYQHARTRKSKPNNQLVVSIAT